MHQSVFFFFNDTATTEIYTLSLHDALPICAEGGRAAEDGHRRVGLRDVGRVELDEREVVVGAGLLVGLPGRLHGDPRAVDELRSEGTRLNSSHANISYAVFCLKKKT